jgi:hypothetical protein
MTYPTASPIAIPPTTSTTNRQPACQSEKVPVRTAVTANPYATRAVASLTRLSPSIRVRSRRGRPRRLAIAVAATASVGATTAPSTKATGHEVPGITAWATAATASIVARTSPIARSASGLAFRRRSRSDVKNADA